MANYITRDSISWKNLLNTASYDWETYELGKSGDYNDSLRTFNNAKPNVKYVRNEAGKIDTVYYFSGQYKVRDSIYYNLRVHGVTAQEVMGYLKTTSSGKYNVYRKMISRDALGLPIPTADWKLNYTHNSGINGKNVILQKVEFVRTYLKEHYNLSLDNLRKEVQNRTYVTNPDGTFALDKDGNVVNKLTSVQEDGQTLIDQLRNQVYRLNSLIQK